MEINKTVYCVVFLLTILSVNAQNNAKFVNTFIGTDGTGHTFPGPSMPFGMVQPGPDNSIEGWNHTSGYQYKDTLLLGFSQMRFSGTGIGEMGNILLLPFNQNINLATIFRKILVSLTYGKNRFSYVVRTRAIRFS